MCSHIYAQACLPYFITPDSLEVPEQEQGLNLPNSERMDVAVLENRLWPSYWRLFFFFYVQDDLVWNPAGAHHNQRQLDHSAR